MGVGQKVFRTCLFIILFTVIATLFRPLTSDFKTILLVVVCVFVGSWIIVKVLSYFL
jgi:uncharacterized membrane protein